MPMASATDQRAPLGRSAAAASLGAGERLDIDLVPCRRVDEGRNVLADLAADDPAEAASGAADDYQFLGQVNCAHALHFGYLLPRQCELSAVGASATSMTS
jgi:hypothetical protein